MEGSPGVEESRGRERVVCYSVSTVPALRECTLGIVRLTSQLDPPRTERFPGTQDLQC